jgi:hypothetical protein
MEPENAGEAGEARDWEYVPLRVIDGHEHVRVRVIEAGGAEWIARQAGEDRTAPADGAPDVPVVILKRRRRTFSQEYVIRTVQRYFFGGSYPSIPTDDRQP